MSSAGAREPLCRAGQLRRYERIVRSWAASPTRWSSPCSASCGPSTAATSTPASCRTLPTEGPRVVMGPGENAGAVDVGGGLACAFKVESHNHPSAVEPFQGAATGVGGILRDVFAVGTRPIAVLDSLRFEGAGGVAALALPARPRGRGHRPLRQLDRRRHGRRGDLLRGGLRAELPRRAMCLGLIEKEKLIRSAAAGVGNVGHPVRGADRSRRDRRRVRARLGRARGGRGQRPTVQIGDPFEVKLLEGLRRAARP